MGCEQSKPEDTKKVKKNVPKEKKPTEEAKEVTKEEKKEEVKEAAKEEEKKEEAREEEKKEEAKEEEKKEEKKEDEAKPAEPVVAAEPVVEEKAVETPAAVEFEELAGVKNSIIDCIGNTPLVWLNRVPGDDCGAKIAVKLESENPANSVKDRLGMAIIKDSEEKGLLTPGKSTIVEATSGILLLFNF